MNPKRTYAVLIIAIGVATAILYGAIAHRSQSPTADQTKLQVAASFYPLYFLAQAIGGERVEVRELKPSGVEPHDYEPAPRDIASLETTDVLVLNGLGLEPWAQNIQKVLRHPPEIVQAGEDLATLSVQGENGITQDPHVWLAPLLVKQEALKVLTTFIEIDVEGKDYYQANAEILEAKLDALDGEYREGLKTCTQKKIITSHAAFGYLAAAYGLEQVPIAGISPEEEPSPQDLARVAELVRKENIHYIFFEKLVSPKFSETIAHETGAQTLVLDPIESGPDYFAQMRSNLANLQQALRCKK